MCAPACQSKLSRCNLACIQIGDFRSRYWPINMIYDVASITIQEMSNARIRNGNCSSTRASFENQIVSTCGVVNNNIDFFVRGQRDCIVPGKCSSEKEHDVDQCI